MNGLTRLIPDSLIHSNEIVFSTRSREPEAGVPPFMASNRKTLQEKELAPQVKQWAPPGSELPLICPEEGHLGAAGAIQGHQRLGGMLNYYHRDAA